MATKDVESFADFLQYYQHKFVRSQSDPREMYHIDGPADPGRPARRVFMTTYRDGESTGQAIYTENQVWKMVQFGLPLIGMTVFNKQELVYLYYRTTRAGNRGFGIDRINQHSFNGWNLQNYGLTRFNPADLMRPWAVWEAVNPKYVKLTDAWNDFNSDTPQSLAYALSGRFGVYLSNKEHPRLCYKMFEIGDVIGPNKVRLENKHAEYREPLRRVLNADMEIEIDETR